MPQGIAITFPSNPTEGQTYLAQNGFTYIYSSLKNQWKRGGDFVRAPKVLSFAGVAATTTGAGVTTGPLGGLIYNVPGFLIPSSDVGVDSYKAYRYTDSYPNYTEIQVSISSAFSTIAYAATSTSTTFTIPANTLSGNTRYYVRARQFVGSNAGAAATGAISGYSQNIVSFATTAVFLDSPTIVSIAGDSDFPAYQVGFAGTTLPATVTYTGSGLGNLQQVEWRVTGPRNPDSTGDTALSEVGIGTFSSATLANALVLAMPFSGATGVGITNDVNGAIRTASSASAGTTKTAVSGGVAGIATVGIATTTSHFYNGAARFNGSTDYVAVTSSSDLNFGSSNFTIEFWYYAFSASTAEVINKSQPLQIYLNTNWQIYISSNGTTYDILNNFNAGTPTLNQWQHLALVRNGNIWSTFLNGVLTNSTTASGSILSNSSQFVIGAYGSPTPNGYFYNGYIQDLKVYNGVAKYQENFTPPLPTYGTISYTTRTIGSVGVATTAFFESTGDIPTAEVAIGSSTAAQVASSLVLAMPMNRTFGFQDINVAVRGLTSGASAGTAKTVGLGTTSTANAPSHPRISSTESKWYDGAAYFDGGDYLDIVPNSGVTADLQIGQGDFTIEFWIYPTSTTSNQHIYGNLLNSNGSAHSYIIANHNFSSGSTLTFGDGSTNYFFGSLSNPVPANVWNHVAFTRTGTSLRCFLNGVQLGAAQTVNNWTNNTTNQLRVGTTADGTYYFTGYLQDLKIYKGFAKYTANFTPPRPICGFTTDLAIQTGFTTTSATGVALTSIVGLGSTSILAFGADQNLVGVTSITSSSGITTLPDPYAQNLVLALPLANITGVGNSFTNDRNTQIRSVSITGAGVTAGTTKTITNTNVSLATTSKWYNGSAFFNSNGQLLSTPDNVDFQFGGVDFTIEMWIYPTLYSGYNTLIAKRQTTTEWEIFLNSGSGALSWYNGSTLFISSTIPTLNTWSHVAATSRNGVITLYLNGVNVYSFSYSTTSSTNTVYIGGISGEPFYGYMQDLKIYKGVAKYNTNFTPPPPMFGDYTRSTPNKIVFTPGSDYVLEARNTATGGIVTSTYSATRQWGTKPKGGIYDPYGANLVLAIPGGAVGGATSTFDVTGQIRYETPTATYVNAGIVTYSNSLGIGTYQNKTVTNTNVSISSTITKYYSRSMDFIGNSTLKRLDINTANSNFGFGTGSFTFEWWMYATSNASGNFYVFDTIGQPIALIRKSTGGMTLETGGSSGAIGEVTILSSGSYGLNKWTHWAVVRNGTNVSVYIDGILTQSTNGFSGVNFGDANGAIGASNNSTSASFNVNAYLSDFRIYKGVAKYTSNFTPPNQIYLT